MTTQITSNSHIVVTLPKNTQKRTQNQRFYRYEENDKQMEIAKIQQVLMRYKQQNKLAT